MTLNSKLTGTHDVTQARIQAETQSKTISGSELETKVGTLFATQD